MCTSTFQNWKVWKKPNGGDLFRFTEEYFDVKIGTIRATVLVETLPAVFQMEEILYAMRDHIVAMNCGRWDYIFSYIKTLKNHKDRILPDRHSVGMDKPFLNAYSQLLVKTCHARGALADGRNVGLTFRILIQMLCNKC